MLSPRALQLLRGFFRIVCSPTDLFLLTMDRLRCHLSAKKLMQALVTAGFQNSFSEETLHSFDLVFTAQISAGGQMIAGFDDALVNRERTCAQIDG